MIAGTGPHDPNMHDGTFSRVDPRDGDSGSGPQWARSILSFTVATAIAFATLALPGIQVANTGELLIGGLLVVAALVTWGAAPKRWPHIYLTAASLTYLAGVAVLRDAQGANHSLFGALVFLPVLWVALHGTVRQLVTVILGSGAVFLVPMLVIGSPSYPASDWGRVLVTPAVTGMVGYAVYKLVRDERWRSASLAELQQRQALVLGATGAGILEIDLDGVVTFADGLATQLTGHATMTLLGASYRIVTDGPEHGEPPTRPSAPRHPLEETMADGQTRECGDQVFWRADGSSMRVAYWTAAVHRDGHRRGTVVAFRDITEQAAAAGRIEAQRELIDAVLDSIDVGIAACGPDGQVTLVNRATKMLHGIGEDDDMPPEAWFDRFEVFTEDGHTPLQRRDFPLLQAMKHGTVHDTELVIVPHGTAPKRVVIHGRRLQSPDGSTVGAVVAMHDITARRHAEQEVSEARDLFSGVLDGATEQSIIGTDPHGLITVFNRGAERMLGYTAAEMIGVATPAVLHDAEEVKARARELGIDPTFEVFVASARRGQPETREWTYITADGRRLQVSLAVSAMRDESGSLKGFIGVATDITERRAAERLKEQFVALVSHELRTPLTAIVGYLEMLLDEADTFSQTQARFLATVDRNAKRLLDLVGDLLTTAQIDAGRMTVDTSEVDLNRVAAAAVESARPRAEGAEVRVGLCSDEGLLVVADAGRIGQAIDNLLTNAIKFTPPGGRVEVCVSRCASGCQIEVSDTGIGIPEEEQHRLFNRFFRATTATDRGIPGIGLGLAIVKSIVDAHHGTIEFSSTPGSGTTFRIELPCETPAAVGAGSSSWKK